MTIVELAERADALIKIAEDAKADIGAAIAKIQAELPSADSQKLINVAIRADTSGILGSILVVKSTTDQLRPVGSGAGQRPQAVGG